MMTTRFCRYELRTTDATAAQAFYTTVLGRSPALVSRLPEQALARGAKPHWLGHLGVLDPESTATAFERRGATRLGPARPSADSSRIILRDPGGALVGIGTDAPSADAPGHGVMLHSLNARDSAAAKAHYGELFGWSMRSTLNLGALGSFQSFAWSADGPTVGVIADIADRPEVHAQWLFFFGVDDFDRTLSAAREHGALVLDPISLPDGTRLCACDDPEGAAFGIFGSAPRG